jgi:hypothetical protein
MDGFTAFKLWLAMKQHFNSKSFDVVKNRGRMRCKFETYLARKDYDSFERIACKFESVREYIVYLAANMMYGNDSMIWDYATGIANFNQYLNRREHIKQLIATDLKTLAKMGIQIDDGIAVVRTMVQNQISFESVVVLNKFVKITSMFDKLPQKVMLEPLLMRIDKSVTFTRIPSDVENYIKNKLTELDLKKTK